MCIYSLQVPISCCTLLHVTSFSVVQVRRLCPCRPQLVHLLLCLEGGSISVPIELPTVFSRKAVSDEGTPLLVIGEGPLLVICDEHVPLSVFAGAGSGHTRSSIPSRQNSDCTDTIASHLINQMLG